MPKITLMPDGAKMARAVGGNKSPVKRGKISGWSRSTARRNTDFLMSIDSSKLNGKAVAFTLTIKDIPPTHSEWERLRMAYVHRLRRMGMIRLHWLTEFQKRGAPHLHGIAYFDNEYSGNQNATGVVYHWIELTSCFGTLSRSQHASVVHDMAGWKQYLGKHGSRSVTHYQRTDIAPGWEKTGRMWGKCGEWPTMKEEIEIGQDDYFRYRRFIRNYLLSGARSELIIAKRISNESKRKAEVKRAIGRIKYLKRRHVAKTKQFSQLRGFTDWIDPGVSRHWLSCMAPGRTIAWESDSTKRQIFPFSAKIQQPA